MARRSQVGEVHSCLRVAEAAGASMHRVVVVDTRHLITTSHSSSSQGMLLLQVLARCVAEVCGRATSHTLLAVLLV